MSDSHINKWYQPISHEDREELIALVESSPKWVDIANKMYGCITDIGAIPHLAYQIKNSGYHVLIGPHGGFTGYCRQTMWGLAVCTYGNPSGMYMLPKDYVPANPIGYPAGLAQWKLDFPDHAKQLLS